MKINKISVSNFRGKNFDFSPSLINLLFLPNASGKTSLCDAIRYGITGLTPKDEVCDTKVVISFEKGQHTLVTERYHGKSTVCKVNSRRATEKATNDTVSAFIGVPVDEIKIISSSEVFSSKRPEEFLQLLINYIPEELDIDRVLSYFTDATDEVKEECSIFFPSMPQKFGIGEIKGAYEYFFDQRKLLKSILQNRKAILTSLSPLPPERTLKEVEDELADLSVQEKYKNSELEKRRQYEAALKQRAVQDRRIAELQKQIGTVPVTQPSQRQLSDCQSRRTEAEAQRLSMNGELTVIESNIRLFHTTLSNLDKPVCPISDKLVCTTEKTEIREELLAALQDNNRLLLSLKEKIERQNAVIKECTAQEQNYAVQKAAYEQYLRRITELNTYKNNLTTVPPEPPVIHNSSQSGQRRKELLNARKNIEDYNNQQNLIREIKGINHKLNICNYIVTALADKGEVKNSIIEYYLTIFEKICNSRAAQFAPGYEIKLIAGNGVRIQMKTPANNDFYSLSGLSDGENLIAIFIVLDMLNQLSNTRIMFIDNVETLDKKALENLAALVSKPEFQASYDHIFICGVNHSEVVTAFQDINALRIKDFCQIQRRA